MVEDIAICSLNNSTTVGCVSVSSLVRGKSRAVLFLFSFCFYLIKNFGVSFYLGKNLKTRFKRKKK